jgi:hypothetical protein
MKIVATWEVEKYINLIIDDKQKDYYTNFTNYIKTFDEIKKKLKRKSNNQYNEQTYKSVEYKIYLIKKLEIENDINLLQFNHIEKFQLHMNI